MLRKGEGDSWKSELSPGDIAVVESICGPLMRKYSYQVIGRGIPLKYRAYRAAQDFPRKTESAARHLFSAAKRTM